MPEDSDASETIKSLELSVQSLTDEWTEYLKSESQRRCEEAARSSREVDEWERSQSFLNRHGAKLFGGLATALSAGLAWYGAQIRADIDAENRAGEVDKSIGQNRKDLEEFEKEAREDIRELQIDSVNQTIMIQKGFDRLDKTMIKAFPRQFPDEDSLPPIDPEFKSAADAAAKKKLRFDRFGVGFDED